MTEDTWPEVKSKKLKVYRRNSKAPTWERLREKLSLVWLESRSDIWFHLAEVQLFYLETVFVIVWHLINFLLNPATLLSPFLSCNVLSQNTPRSFNQLILALGPTTYILQLHSVIFVRGLLFFWEACCFSCPFRCLFLKCLSWIMEGVEWTKVKYMHSRDTLRTPPEHQLKY
jgi:hypothetical protein